MVAVSFSSGSSQGSGSTPSGNSSASVELPSTKRCLASTVARASSSSGSTSNTDEPECSTMYAISSALSRKLIGTSTRPKPLTPKNDTIKRAAGLNRADLMQVQGLYPSPPGSPPDIPGMELAGEVVATGPGVTAVDAGDSVMALVGAGAQAELAVVHERLAMRVPDSLGWPDAGGFP